MAFLLPWIPFYILAGLFLYGVLRLDRSVKERGRWFLRLVAVAPGLIAAGVAALLTNDNALIVSTVGAAGACLGAGGALLWDNFLERTAIEHPSAEQSNHSHN